jgi:hypothetical protein
MRSQTFFSIARLKWTSWLCQRTRGVFWCLMRAACLYKCSLVLFALVGLAFHPPAAADMITYVDIDDVSMYGGGTPILYDFDLDGDSVIDFVFESSQTPTTGFRVQPQGNNRVVATPADRAAPLSSGISINETLPASFMWSSSASLLMNTCAAFPEGIVCIGDFNNVIGFLGLEFEISGQTHYGWMRINTDEFSIIAGGTALDYAYSTAPGQGILAGAIPEPSTTLLFVLGALSVLVTHRQRIR